MRTGSAAQLFGQPADPAQGGTVLLGYAGLSEEEIAEAAAILKKCWNA